MKMPFVLRLILIWGALGHAARCDEPRPALSRALLHNTVRIETQKADGSHVGTGFFYAFQDQQRTSSIPVVVTCWHVVSGSVIGHMDFALAASNGLSRVQDHFRIELPPALWIRHPDTNVDLAIMPIAMLMRGLESKGKLLDFRPTTENLIPGDAELLKYGAFEEVKFIGYPIGIWDEKNNLPVARRGMTATDLAVDYNGRTEFLVDAAVFPGSSGSPVYIVDEGVISFDGRLSIGGNRLRFLGILYAVHQFTSEGKVEIVTVPTAFDARVKTPIPANLGLVIKASRLSDFKAVLERIVKTQEEKTQKSADANGATTGK
jgi:hypothetical protein